jgi:hypothetical protein
METLKSVLEASHAKKTKNELIELLSGVEKFFTRSLRKVSGIEPSELGTLTNKELLIL